MDYLLYLLILVIVIATGYVLSKPLIKSVNRQEMIDAEVNRERYDRLLGEIKDLEDACEAEAIPKEVCHTQIRAKKRQAADLLRKLNPRLDISINEEHAEYSTENIDDQPPSNLPDREADICPQCGHKVMKSDKFCMHCGHRLRP
jgi:hypothetical protein